MCAHTGICYPLVWSLLHSWNETVSLDSPWSTIQDISKWKQTSSCCASVWCSSWKSHISVGSKSISLYFCRHSVLDCITSSFVLPTQTHFFNFRRETASCNQALLWPCSPLFSFQGLFRIAAGASKLKKLKAALDCSTSQLEGFYSDPHAVAGTTSTNPQKVKTSAPGFCLMAYILFLIHRSSQVLPQGTSWTSNDI